MYSIFISYNSSDKKFAHALKEALEGLGYKVWIDFRNLEPSMLWSEEIIKAIKQSVAFIYLISQKSLSEESYCRKEFSDAEKLGKKIIPILLPSMVDHRKLPYEVAKYHCIKWETLGNIHLDISDLEKTIRTNFKWTEFHTKLTGDSDKWQKDDRKRIEHPLSKKEIHDAQRMFLEIKEDEYPQPTEIIKNYVFANEKRLTWLRIFNTFVSVSILGVICIAMGITIYQSWIARQAVLSVEPLQEAKSAAEATAQAEQERANQEAEIAHIGLLVDQADAITESNPIISYLLSVELYKRRQNAQTFSLLKKNAYANSQIFRFVTGAGHFAGGSVSLDGLDHFFGPGEKFSTAAISPDGKMVAFSVRDKIIFQSIALGEDLQVFTISTNEVGDDEHSYGLVFSPDSKYIASDSKEGKVVLWDINNGTVLKKLDGFKESALIRRLAYSSDGQYLVATSQNDNKLIVWDIASGKVKCNIETNSSEYGVSFVPQTDKFITSPYLTLSLNDFNYDVNDKILIWETSTCRSDFFVPNEPVGNVGQVFLSSDGDIIALVIYDQGDMSIVVLDFFSRKPLLTLKGKDILNFRTLAISYDGKKLAAGYELGKISVWDVDTGEKINEFQFGASSVNFLAFTPDGRFLLSNGVIWHLDNNLRNDANGITHDSTFGDRYNFGIPSFNIVPESDSKYQDVTLFVERMSDGVRIVDESSQPIGTPLIGLPSSTRIEVFAFSQDNKYLAIGGNDGTVSLWDVSNTRLLSILNGNSGSINGLGFSSDNKTLTASSELSVQTWDIDFNSWLNRVCQAAGRNFTLEEWGLYFPNEDYQKTCPQWIEGK